MQMSPAGQRFLSQWEGLVLHPYNDSVSNATIGIGHLIHYGPVTALDIEQWSDFTLAKAYALLAEDLVRYERYVEAVVRVKLNQNQFDALVDIVYNCGPGVIDGSLGSDINEQNWAAACAEMLQWDHAGGAVSQGLSDRRQAEVRLFNTPMLITPSNPLAILTPVERVTVQEFLSYAKHPHINHKVLAEITVDLNALRKAVWHEAQGPGGWSAQNRGARYHLIAKYAPPPKT